MTAGPRLRSIPCDGTESLIVSQNSIKLVNTEVFDNQNDHFTSTSVLLAGINTGLSIAGSSGGVNHADMFQHASIILYVHFGNSREGRSTSGGGFLCSPPSN